MTFLCQLNHLIHEIKWEVRAGWKSTQCEPRSLGLSSVEPRSPGLALGHRERSEEY